MQRRAMGVMLIVQLLPRLISRRLRRAKSIFEGQPQSVTAVAVAIGTPGLETVAEMRQRLPLPARSQVAEAARDSGVERAGLSHAFLIFHNRRPATANQTERAVGSKRNRVKGVGQSVILGGQFPLIITGDGMRKFRRVRQYPAQTFGGI